MSFMWTTKTASIGMLFSAHDQGDLRMALALETWGALVDDERTRILIQPLVRFFDLDERGYEVSAGIDDPLEKDADLIPRVIEPRIVALTENNELVLVRQYRLDVEAQIGRVVKGHL